MIETIYETIKPQDLPVFVLLTLVLGGGAAWRTGQVVAEGWGALWPVVAYVVLIAAGVRFLDWALFSGPLLSLEVFLRDASILLLIALLAHRLRRARHMTEQYPWLFTRVGPFGWRARQVT